MSDSDNRRYSRVLTGLEARVHTCAASNCCTVLSEPEKALLRLLAHSFVRMNISKHEVIKE